MEFRYEAENEPLDGPERGQNQQSYQRTGSQENLHVLRKTAETDDQNAVAAIRKVNECLFKEVGESEGSSGLLPMTLTPFLLAANILVQDQEV